MAIDANGNSYAIAARSETLDAEFLAITATHRGRTIMGSARWTISKADVYVVDDSSYSGADLPVRVSGVGLAPDVEPGPEPKAAQNVRTSPGRDQMPLVTILGAGITGLTAAHELIERGFRVQVIEKNHGGPLDLKHSTDIAARLGTGLDRPDVGGVARTQWCTAPAKVAPDGVMSRLASLAAVDWLGTTREDWGNEPSILPLLFKGNSLNGRESQLAALEKWIVARAGRSYAAFQVVIVIYGKRVRSAYKRLLHLLEQLKSVGALKHLDCLPVARIEVDDARHEGEFVGALLRSHEHPGLIAGEHGNRFFAGCYRHLRDTMRRTPIFDHAGQRFTTQTVHDFLTPLRSYVVADPTRDSRAVFSRSSASSLGAVIKRYQDLRRDLGYRPADLLRYSLRLLRYMTSSTERRAKYYEDLSWWEFVTRRHLDRADRDSARMARRFESVLTQALETSGAILTTDADARTVGNFSVQLQLTAAGYGNGDADATLRGPSSEVWFKHWRDYLERRGVRFFVGEVTAIDTTTGRVDICFPTTEEPPGYAPPHGKPGLSYYLCAMDAPSVARVAKRSTSTGVPAQIRAFVPRARRPAPPDRNSAKATRFQTLTGIQFFYRARLSPDTAHIYYAESAWRLSAISQVQQWDLPNTAGLGLSSSLSVNIGSWNPHPPQAAIVARPPGPNPVPPAARPPHLAPDEIARAVVDQIGEGRAPSAPVATYFHIDDYVQFGRDDHNSITSSSRAPYLVNIVGDWKRRPRGKPWSPADRKLRPRRLGDGSADASGVWQHRKGGYPVHLGNIVFAGPHLRTFSRLTSMEAANESARHAVNAILDHLALSAPEARSRGRDPHHDEERVPPRGAYCDIWNPEQHELDDLELLRAIDRHLVKQGDIDPLDADDIPVGKSDRKAPIHVFDLLGVDHLPALVETDASSDRVFQLLGLAIDALQRGASKDPSSVFAVIETYRKQFEEFLGR